ncbi:heterokaryon incompatibility protein-domain-containing protein, partial [Lasiosphaeris hirsuta]
MRVRFRTGVRDCGHWTAPFQDEINFATLQAQAADCRSCASVVDWVLTMHASRCDGETDYAAVMQALRKNRRPSCWRAILHRLGLSCVRGAWFTWKFVKDVSLTMLLCGAIAVSIAFVPILGTLSIVGVAAFAALVAVCCCGCGAWLRLTLDTVANGFVVGFAVGIGAFIGVCDLTYEAILRMLGANFGRDEGHVAPPAWTELDDNEGYRYARVSDVESRGINDMDLPIARLRRESVELAHAPWLQLPRGSSCLRISSASSLGSPGLACNIYQHTYNPRGPIGSFVYFAPKVGQRENHPTGFLSLAAGKLFLAAWPREHARWDTMRSRVGSSVTKLVGQEYDQIEPFTTKPDLSSRVVGTPLPTRLIDLGEGCFRVENLTVSALRLKLSKSRVKLVTTPPEARGRYLTLSHRWGDDEHFKLTQSCLSSFHRDGIAFSTIPKTFQDAIVAARLLRHRYLWVDALCIVQDDPDDWAHESARMAAVYHNASCTISAHTARNSNDGFLDASLDPPPTLVLRSPRYFFNPRRTITHLTLLGSFTNQVAGSFLSQRGWVFQERVLSQRLLHFVQHHTFFEDHAGVVADDVGSANLPPLHRLEDNKWSVTDSFHGFVYWCRLIQKYSRCCLTYEKDRLPAIAGLAQSFSEMNDTGAYMFGLWERSLHMGFLWVNGSGRPIERGG